MRHSTLMSAEAQKFLDEAPALEHGPVDPATIDKLRADTRAGFEPAARRAIARHKVQTQDIEVAGVACMETMPEGEQAIRTVLYCYGGGYVTGSPFEDLPIIAALADHLKARVVAIGYRLAPEHPYPAAVDDGFAVYQSISSSCAPGTWAIAGESAGGNLALALLQKADAAGLAMPGAAALLSPWCDLASQGDSLSGNAGRDPTLHPDHLEDAARAYAGDRDLADPLVSPIYGAFSDRFPPVIMTTGTRDLLLSGVVRLSRVMQQAGVSVDLRVWDGLWHVFEFYDELPEAAASLQDIADHIHIRLTSV